MGLLSTLMGAVSTRKLSDFTILDTGSHNKDEYGNYVARYLKSNPKVKLYYYTDGPYQVNEYYLKGIFVKLEIKPGLIQSHKISFPLAIQANNKTLNFYFHDKHGNGEVIFAKPVNS